MNIVQIKGSEVKYCMPKLLENVKETILTEAKEMLINSDYESFNIRDLSNKCNISIGTIYNYFPNKSQLIGSIFIEDWNKALDRMKNININFNSLEDKLFQVYTEMDNFLSDYLIIFMQMSSNPSLNTHPSCLTTLYPLIDEIITFERENGTITSTLPNEKLYKIIINNLLMPCNDKSITFQDLFSIIKL